MQESFIQSIKNRVLPSLTPKEEYVLRLYFGIDRDEPMSLRQVAEHMGTSHDTVWRTMQKVKKLIIEKNSDM